MLSMFMARHSGVSNPSLCYSFRGFSSYKVTFVVEVPAFGYV